jgi:hypothetical protein
MRAKCRVRVGAFRGVCFAPQLKSKVSVTATAAGTVWIAVGLGLKVQGGKIVLGKDGGVTERSMTAQGVAGVGDALLSTSIDTATFVQANGQSVLMFTGARIAGQAMNLLGTDNIIAAKGPKDNTWNAHETKGTTAVTWIPAPAAENSTMTPTEGPPAFISLKFLLKPSGSIPFSAEQVVARFPLPILLPTSHVCLRSRCSMFHMTLATAGQDPINHES